EGKFADLVIQFLFLRRFLRKTRARNLRVAISTTRENTDLLRLAVTEHAFDGLNRPERSNVSEPGRALNVTRRIDARRAGLIIGSDLHESAIGLDLNLVGKQSVERRGNANRDQHRLDFQFRLGAAFDEVELHTLFADANVFTLR